MVAIKLPSGFFVSFFFCYSRLHLDMDCVILPGSWTIVNAKAGLDYTAAGARPNLSKMHVLGFSCSIPTDPLPFTLNPSTSLLQFEVTLK